MGRRQVQTHAQRWGEVYASLRTCTRRRLSPPRSASVHMRREVPHAGRRRLVRLLQGTAARNTLSSNASLVGRGSNVRMERTASDRLLWDPLLQMQRGTARCPSSRRLMMRRARSCHRPTMQTNASPLHQHAGKSLASRMHRRATVL